jgi:RES domain-containing protein
MIVYRICKARYSKTAYSGAGGMESSGRWHHKGKLIAYTAATLSLAALEYFIHLGRVDIKADLTMVSAMIPKSLRIEELDPHALPKDWTTSPPGKATMDIGTQWCLDLRTAALRVPSAIVEGEFNYLLNPRHDDFVQIKIATPEPFSFDPRMWK